MAPTPELPLLHEIQPFALAVDAGIGLAGRGRWRIRNPRYCGPGRSVATVFRQFFRSNQRLDRLTFRPDRLCIRRRTLPDSTTAGVCGRRNDVSAYILAGSGPGVFLAWVCGV